MRVGVLGTNFKTAKLEVREALSLACQKKISVFSEMGRKNACVVLATCNRVEIYFSAPDLAEAHSELLQVLKEEIETPFEHQLYSYFGLDCFMHLAHVTSGLDSAIVAESEIQRQVKISYEQALLHYRLPACVHYLFQKSLKLGKHIRSCFSLSLNEVTIPKLLFEMGKSLYADLKSTSVLFVGNSEINRQIISYFKHRGLSNLTLCSRSLYAAKDVVEQMGLSLLSWDHLSGWHRYPWVICGSNSPHYVVTPTQKGVQTQLICDLSMPRTVDPLVASYSRLSLLNMEQLIDSIQERQQKNEQAVQEAKQAITQGVDRYLGCFLSKEARVRICI
jgi:glutamyl-tRNA reductase